MKNSNCKRWVRDLPQPVLKTLSMHLNPRMIVGGDWMSLAGEFGKNYMEIRNFELAPDPTMAVLEDWWSDVGDKTVSRLMDIMKKIKRFDVFKILEPCEFYGMSFHIHGINTCVVVIHKHLLSREHDDTGASNLCEFSPLACSKE